jgi:glycogen synthase
MPIKIIGYDENRSKKDATSSIIVFKLSEAPNDGWESNFNNCRQKNREPLINSTGINGKELIVQAPSNLTAQQILDAMNKCIEIANNAEGDFMNQLSELKF